MKKAEKYLKECDFDGHFVSVDAFLSAIKKAQSDTIDEAVKMCADEAKCELNDYFDCTDEQQINNIEIWEEGCDSASYCVKIDKNSILQVADKLKKEL